MHRERLAVWTTRLLLGFALVTLGYAWGKHSAAPPAEGVVRVSDEPAGASALRLRVYAAHMTQRCPGCMKIEALTRELLQEEFAAELASGAMEMLAVDFTKNPAFALRYDISSSVILLSRIRDGAEIGSERLDDVWAHFHDREAFFTYLREALRRGLEGGEA